MSEHEIVMALERCGVRANPKARAALAKDLEARGVLCADITRAHQFLVESREHNPAGAARVLATLLADDSQWRPFLADVGDVATRRAPTQRTESGAGQRISPEEQRVREYRAAGLGDDEARMLSKGGYAHARIVGDGARPADVAKDNGVDPFEIVHIAAHWADLFGQGRGALRKALQRAVKAGIAAESLLEELDHCPVRSLGGEKPEPILTGWRARAPRPTRTMSVPLPVTGDSDAANSFGASMESSVRALQEARKQARAMVERVKPKTARQPVAAAAASTWDAPVYGEDGKVP